MTASLSLISIPTYLHPFPPKLSVSRCKLFANRSQNFSNSPAPTRIRRREAVSLSSLALFPLLSKPDPAAAISIGISGPKDWLKEQKRKASRFLLAPIDASRESLRSAYLLLTGNESEDKVKELEEVQRLFRSAARDCVPEDRNSFVTFQANTGVEVCTFSLIVKNASSLLDKKDPVKLEAEAMLKDLVRKPEMEALLPKIKLYVNDCYVISYRIMYNRSFSSLYVVANETDIQLASNRKKIADALTNTISSLDKFEQLVMECLEV